MRINSRKLCIDDLSQFGTPRAASNVCFEFMTAIIFAPVALVRARAIINHGIVDARSGRATAPLKFSVLNQLMFGAAVFVELEATFHIAINYSSSIVA